MFIIRILITLIILAFFNSVSTAQTLTWGPEEKFGGASAPAGFKKIDEQGYFLIRNRQFAEENNPFQLNTPLNKFYLMRYDAKGQLLYEQNYAKELGKSEIFPAIFSAGKNLYLSTAISKKGNLEFYYRKINPGTGTFASEPKKYATLNNVKEKGYVTFKELNSLDGSKTLLLLNSSKKLLLRRINNFSDGDIHVAVFDGEKDMLWQENLILEEKEKGKGKALDMVYVPSTLSILFLDNLGNAHIIASPLKNLKDESKEKKATFMSYDVKGHKYRSLFLEEAQMSGFKVMDIDNNGRFLMAKFPDEDNPSIQVNYLEAAATTFGEPVITDLDPSEHKAFDGSISFGDMRILSFDDGSKILLQEDCGSMQVSFNSSKTCTDIRLVKLSAKGRVLWTQRIEKKQFIPGNTDFYSFFYTNIGEDLVILFNDEYSNVSRTKGKIVQVKISPKGEMERKIIHEARDPALLMVPDKSFKSKENRISLLTRWQGDYRMLHLDY